jgi:hypothetical protein
LHCALAGEIVLTPPNESAMPAPFEKNKKSLVLTALLQNPVLQSAATRL